MNQFNLLGYCLAPLVAFFSSPGSASDELFDLSLQELLRVNVVSKREENIDEAAGVVSVITAADIQRFGARYLRDLIDRLPNTQVIGSALYPHNRTSMRGVTQTHLDDKVLILLNGRPLCDAGQGGVNGDFYSSFPLALLQQIEVIRGLQVNKPQGGDADLAPRLAGVFTLADHWSLKLAYDQAYHSAFGLDLFLNASFLLGNPELEPETIETYSAQLSYKSPPSTSP